MSALVLLDNTVLSNLAQACRADLPVLLWPGIVATSPGVMAEYRAGVSTGELPEDAWEALLLVGLTDEEERQAAGLPARLGKGERECLALAVSRQALFATDDHAARRWAEAHGVALTGTLGILALTVQGGHITLDSANTLLRAMIDAGFHSVVSDLTLLLPG